MKRTIEVEVSTCKKCGCEMSGRLSSELGIAAQYGADRDYCWDCGTAKARKQRKKEVMRDLKGAVVTSCEAGSVRLESITVERPDGAVFTIYVERYFQERP